MDYNKIKLGIIGRLKIWSARREAEKNREWRDSIEYETSEVDYSEVEKLEADLLEQKRIKRATRDASRLYKKVYGKNNDGIGEADFIEDYLVENGLKQKALPEPEISKKHSFIEQYPTKKSEEELSYEQARQNKTMYYEIGGIKYEVPSIFSHKYFKQMKSGNADLDFQLTTNDGINYVIKTQDMTPEAKNNMLKRMIDLSLSQIGEETYIIAEVKPDTELKESFSKLTRQASYNDYVVKKMLSEGKIKEANSRLEKMTGKILKFYQDISKGEQEEVRE